MLKKPENISAPTAALANPVALSTAWREIRLSHGHVSLADMAAAARQVERGVFPYRDRGTFSLHRG